MPRPYLPVGKRRAVIERAQGCLVPLFHPRRQQWYDHFAWSDDYRSIVALTTTGRATVSALQMNRLPLMNIRAVLYLA